MEVNSETDVWGIVEIMGHSRFAGRISQSQQFGVPLIRIEIPETKNAPAFEKHFGAASIFAVTPCTEAAARLAAEQFRERPTVLVDLTARPALPALRREEWDEDEDADDDDLDPI